MMLPFVSKLFVFHIHTSKRERTRRAKTQNPAFYEQIESIHFR